SADHLALLGDLDGFATLDACHHGGGLLVQLTDGYLVHERQGTTACTTPLGREWRMVLEHHSPLTTQPSGGGAPRCRRPLPGRAPRGRRSTHRPRAGSRMPSAIPGRKFRPAAG